MTMRITMRQTRMGESGSLLDSGSTYTVSDAFGAAMVGAGYATDTDLVLSSPKATGLQDMKYNPLTQSAVSGDGTPISFAGPAYTWVNRPAAASNAGMVIRITDIGPTGFGSMWMSDGTNWRTLTGEQVLISGRTGVPGTALATATTAAKLNLPAGDMITAGSLVFPAGLLRPGVGLRINSFIRHTGTAGTWAAIFRIGTSNSASDSSLARGDGSATNDQTLWTFMDCNIATNTSITTAYNMQPNAAASGGSYAARTTNIDFTAATYLGIYVSALTPPDTIELQNYSISLLD